LESKKIIQNVHCRNANTCCRDDAANERCRGQE